MNWLQEMWQQMARMQWSDYLDIILVALLFYKLYPMVRSTGASRVLRVVLLLMVVSWVTGPGILNMHTLHYLLSEVLAVGLIAVVILFQPELRRMLDHLGNNMKLQKILGTQKAEPEMIPVIAQTVRACEYMSRERVGALIVFHRDTVLQEYINTGTVVDAQVSEQLLRNIFFPKAALHDGATIIRGGRIAAAGCVLPLSESNRLSADLGTRHRAGVGMSEASDAVVVIVSEETGAISVAVGGMLKRHLAPQTLELMLRSELCHEERKEENLVIQLRHKLKRKEREDEDDEEQ